MKKFKVDFEMTITIEYSDSDKLMKYLQGEWSNHFYDFDDLEEVTRFWTSNLYAESTYLKDGNWIRSIEGFMCFVEKGNAFVSEYVDYGTITIKIAEDLDTVYVSEDE